MSNDIILYDHFTKPLMFKSLDEVREHLEHFPFSYDDPPSEDKPWNVVHIISYRDIVTLKKIIDKCINSGLFKLMHAPEVLNDVIDLLKKDAKNSLPTAYS